MKVVSQFVISLFDLIEAEGRALLSVARTEARDLRASVVSLATGAAFLLVSIPLFVGSAWLLAAGLLWWLETEVGRPLAATLTGLAVLSLAVLCLLLFRTLSGRKAP